MTTIITIKPINRKLYHIKVEKLTSGWIAFTPSKPQGLVVLNDEAPKLFNGSLLTYETYCALIIRQYNSRGCQVETSEIQ